MDLETVADELYALSPAEFTSARDARASDARKAGDRDLAASIKSLRRPTKSAWLANVLVRRRREQIDELLDLGETMREAQQQLAGEELRQLSRRRHELVSALGQQARDLARESSRPATDEMVLELEATLEAALADPAASDAVRSGRLTSALSYSGFGSVDPGALAVAAPRKSSRQVAKPPRRHAAVTHEDESPEARERRGAEIASAEKALREAEKYASAARRDAEQMGSRAAKADADARLLSRQLANLEAKLSQLSDKSAEAVAAAHEARRACDASEHTLGTAEASVARAKEALDHLEH
jgi:chromosome segregation ATPase